jgi:hypothetical protein
LGRQPRRAGDVEATLAGKNRARGWPWQQAGGVGADLGGRVPWRRSSSVVEPSSWATGNQLPTARSHHAGKGGPRRGAVESGGGARRDPAAGRRQHGGVKLGGGGSSYRAAAWHVSKVEVETAPPCSSPPASALSLFPPTPPLSSFPPACRREGGWPPSQLGRVGGGRHWPPSQLVARSHHHHRKGWQCG